jgi:hypothetical protein
MPAPDFEQMGSGGLASTGAFSSFQPPCRHAGGRATDGYAPGRVRADRRRRLASRLDDGASVCSRATGAGTATALNGSVCARDRPFGGPT